MAATSTIVRFANTGARSRNKPSLLEKLEVYQGLLRDGGTPLTPGEFRVMMALVDATVGWGQEWVRLPVEEFATRCNYRPAMLRRLVSRLRARGLLEVECDGRCNRYAVRLGDEAMAPKLPIPKRHRGATDPGQTATIVAGRPLQSYRDAIDIADRTPLEEPTVRRTVATLRVVPTASAEEAVSLATARNAQARTRRRGGRAGQATPGSLEEVWRAAHAAAGLTDPVRWRMPTKRRAVAMVEEFPGDKAELDGFLEWAVVHWVQAVASFKWMKDKPARPHFVLLCKLLEAFLNAYRDGVGTTVPGAMPEEGSLEERVMWLRIKGRSAEANELVRRGR